MRKPAFDPGLTLNYGAPLRRAINKDGSFNVRRSGGSWRAFHPWARAVRMSRTGFAALVLGCFLAVNFCFACAYFLLGPGEIQGSDAPTEWGRFLNDLFFSAHTLTTVGYGSLSPHGVGANLLAAVEALLGLMAFALGTGILLARVSRPSARITFSTNAIVAPYLDGSALMFRIANERQNNLMELRASVLLSTVENSYGELKRRYQPLDLERDRILFFPLTWTVVHPIAENSPLFGRTPGELEAMQAEVFILVMGFDDTFSQTVHVRYSYRFDEIAWGRRFVPAFHVDPAGNLVLELDKVGELAPD